ncbi:MULTISPECIES: lipocalin family protein [Empedobacter]|uniref:Lipocalin/cytosolic fatty-acid binding domain-containing protein n=1 Tax=Empedobacter stercoris TaxID=1628248 RepID=A0ABX1WI63_9FLAO|nr:lipocalin family protein [Empedobacter stercoris]MDM1542869.1 lipocalin family protein [Empedobacter sp. 189-2]NOJ74349.1 hypothetical protein [Empedobacter stercoris]
MTRNSATQSTICCTYCNHYNNALVASEDYKKLWILLRKKEISDKVKDRFLDSAKKVGFDPNKLIWLSQLRITK